MRAAEKEHKNEQNSGYKDREVHRQKKREKKGWEKSVKSNIIVLWIKQMYLVIQLIEHDFN